MNKKKRKINFAKVLIVLGLIAAIVLLIWLIVKEAKPSDNINRVDEDIDYTQTELIKATEDIYADNDFLIESFGEYEDGNRFYLAGTNLIDYDYMYVFHGELPREEIINTIGYNFEEIKDKAADDVLVVFVKNGKLTRLFNMKESECGFNFVSDNLGISFAVQSRYIDVFYETKVENGLKIHHLYSRQNRDGIRNPGGEQ